MYLFTQALLVAFEKQTLWHKDFNLFYNSNCVRIRDIRSHSLALFLFQSKIYFALRPYYSGGNERDMHPLILYSLLRKTDTDN